MLVKAALLASTAPKAQHNQLTVRMVSSAPSELPLKSLAMVDSIVTRTLATKKLHAQLITTALVAPPSQSHVKISSHALVKLRLKSSAPMVTTLTPDHLHMVDKTFA